MEWTRTIEQENGVSQNNGNQEWYALEQQKSGVEFTGTIENENGIQ